MSKPTEIINLQNSIIDLEMALNEALLYVPETGGLYDRLNKVLMRGVRPW